MAAKATNQPTLREWRFTVPGRPAPKARMTQRSTWTKPARRTLAYQRSVADHGKVAVKETILGPVELTVQFHLKDGIRPDLKNLVAAVEDGLQYGRVIENDRQIVGYGAGTGIYVGTPERADITIRSVER